MLTFTIWLLITTSPTGDVFIDGHYETQVRCLQVATVEQECIEGTVIRPKELYD